MVNAATPDLLDDAAEAAAGAPRMVAAEGSPSFRHGDFSIVGGGRDPHAYLAMELPEESGMHPQSISQSPLG
jgi:hypothetical protein